MRSPQGAVAGCLLGLVLVMGCPRQLVLAPSHEQDAGGVGGLEPVAYSLELTGRPIEGFPGVHSGAYALHDGRLVIIAGRTNGLHHFPLTSEEVSTSPAFPPAQANTWVWVVGLASGKVLGSKPIDALPPKIRAQWRSTNPQYLTLDGQLLIVGGYGPSPLSGKSMVTLPYATSVDIDALVRAVLDPSTTLDAAWASQHIGLAEHLALKVTGGELRALGELHLLMFGHAFDGEYTPSGSLATQTYTEAVRLFRFKPGSHEGQATLGVEYLGQTPNTLTGQDPSGPYHRRDLPVVPVRDADGGLLLAAYGGVFKGGRIDGYLNPVYVRHDGASDGGVTLEVDTAAEQLLSQYACATVPIFDAASGTMYTTLMAGISTYHWDGTALRHDVANEPQGRDGLPFIDSVSTLRVSHEDGGTRTRQYLHRALTFPPAQARPQCGSEPATLGGAQSVFIPDPALGLSGRDGVLDYGGLPTSGRIGWIFGGIFSTAPYRSQGTTCASNMLYEVLLTKRPGDVIELKKP